MTTSSWSALGRAARRSSMPIAWVVTLAVCAGSAFAVRDVVFPSLSPSAAPSLWQPKPTDTTAAGNGTTVPDRIDVGRSTVPVVVVTAPGADTTALDQSTVAGGSAGGTAAPNRLQGGGRPPATTVASSPGTTAPGGDDHTGTTVPKSTNTTVHTSSSVSATTSPDTGDTLPDDSGGRGSGSGRGGNGNDTLP